MSYPPPANDPYQGQVPPQPYGQSPYGQPAAAYASWGARVAAALIDGAILLPFYLIVVFLGTSTDEATGLPTINAFFFIGYLLLLVVGGYNRWFQAGKTGQTWGRKALGIRLVSETTGQPIGAGNAFVRDLAHFVDGIPCGIGYLSPLWDAKNQTWGDKIVKTLVVR